MSDLIAKLSGEKFDAEQRYKAMGMMNTCGLTYDQQKRQRIEYDEAAAELFVADSKLKAAIKG